MATSVSLSCLTSSRVEQSLFMLKCGQHTVLVEERVRTKVMKREGSSPLFGTALKSIIICDREGAKHVVDEY